MELNDYQRLAMTTCTQPSENFAYMLLNLVGEVGEFSSKVAKEIRKDRMLIDDNELCRRSSEVNAENLNLELKKEAGDVMWQLAGLCSMMNWTLEDVAETNLDKLKSRKERGVIVGDGDNR